MKKEMMIKLMNKNLLIYLILVVFCLLINDVEFVLAGRRPVLSPAEIKALEDVKKNVNNLAKTAKTTRVKDGQVNPENSGDYFTYAKIKLSSNPFSPNYSPYIGRIKSANGNVKKIKEEITGEFTGISTYRVGPISVPANDDVVYLQDLLLPKKPNGTVYITKWLPSPVYANGEVIERPPLHFHHFVVQDFARQSMVCEDHALKTFDSAAEIWEYNLFDGYGYPVREETFFTVGIRLVDEREFGENYDAYIQYVVHWTTYPKTKPVWQVFMPVNKQLDMCETMPVFHTDGDNPKELTKVEEFYSLPEGGEFGAWTAHAHPGVLNVTIESTVTGEMLCHLVPEYRWRDGKSKHEKSGYYLTAMIPASPDTCLAGAKFQKGEKLHTKCYYTNDQVRETAMCIWLPHAYFKHGWEPTRRTTWDFNFF